jgi:hypothetical protein
MSFALGDPYSTRLSYNIAIRGDIASAKKSEPPTLPIKNRPVHQVRSSIA